MTPTVHILATVRNPELLRAALLVFNSVRTGFPTANIRVYPNVTCDAPEADRAIQQAALDADCQVVQFEPHQYWTHPEWIRHVITENTGYHWICDTDMVFHEKVEHWEFSEEHMAGWYIPTFRCDYTESITVKRLHTCLMWLNCDAIRKVLETENRILGAPDDLISPITFWNGGKKYFHDTMGQLANHREVNCAGFREKQLDCFTHLFSGTMLDLMSKAVPGLAEAHRLAYEYPDKLRGQWETQLKWYADRQV